MVNHDEALEAADKLVEYCKQHFRGNSRECIGCQFSLASNVNRRCCLDLYVGLWGDAMHDNIKVMVDKRREELQ